MHNADAFGFSSSQERPLLFIELDLSNKDNVFQKSLSNQQRRKHLLPIDFACSRLGISRRIRLGFEPITALRAGPKIKDQTLTHEFRPFRSNQRLSTFHTRRSHGEPPLLVLRFASWEFWHCYSRVSEAVISIDADQTERPLHHYLHCGAITCSPNLQYKASPMVLAYLMPTLSERQIEICRTAWQFSRV